MNTIAKKYVLNEHNEKVAVQIPIKTFEQIEEILENYALFRLMDEYKDEEVLNVQEAKEYYSRLDKK